VSLPAGRGQGKSVGGVAVCTALLCNTYKVLSCSHCYSRQYVFSLGQTGRHWLTPVARLHSHSPFHSARSFKQNAKDCLSLLGAQASPPACFFVGWHQTSLVNPCRSPTFSLSFSICTELQTKRQRLSFPAGSAGVPACMLFLFPHDGARSLAPTATTTRSNTLYAFSS
jgi:hypothetical protein